MAAPPALADSFMLICLADSWEETRIRDPAYAADPEWRAAEQDIADCGFLLASSDVSAL